MKKLPNLFLIGAPKCGTTTVHSWLDKHNNIFMASVKEPHHFDSPYGDPLSEQKYYSLFDRVPDDISLIGEASVWYLYSEVAVKKILGTSPDCKFIVCLRNPVEAALSMHAQKVSTGHELITNFENAWQLRHVRKAGSFEGTLGIDNGDAAHMSYLYACSFGSQLERLFSIVPRDRIFVIFIDDLKKDQERTLISLSKFLDVAPCNTSELKPANKASRRRFLFAHRVLLRLYLFKQRVFPEISTGLLRKINILNSIEEQYVYPSSRIIAEMRYEFSEEIDKMEVLTGRNLSLWR